MDKNYLNHSVYVSGAVVVVLLLLQFVPEQISTAVGLNNTDILADIRKDTAMLLADAERPFVLLPSPPEIEIREIPCPSGIVCFEDYSENNDGLSKFFKALELRDRRTVRAAFFGDSYIEGDIFCGDFRAVMQKEYGGRGVGMMPLASQVSAFRQTVRHTFGSWQSHSITDAGNNHAQTGISGNYFVPENGAWTKYVGVKLPGLDYARRARILYSLPNGETTMTYSLNNAKAVTARLESSPELMVYDIAADSIASLRIDFPASNIRVHGVSLQDTAGVLVDNFSLRGAPGTSLKYIPKNNLSQTDSILGYDLLILQYGLNVMSAKTVHYSSYLKGMKEAVEHLKQAFPESSILLLSVGDRSMKGKNGYETMPGVHAMVACQRQVCMETGIVFWNMFEAMGGNESMVTLVNSKPPKANKDYTHLNFEGGKYLAEILFKTLLVEKEKYGKPGLRRTAPLSPIDRKDKPEKIVSADLESPIAPTAPTTAPPKAPEKTADEKIAPEKTVPEKTALENKQGKKQANAKPADRKSERRPSARKSADRESAEKKSKRKKNSSSSRKQAAEGNGR
jgi:hypothetical protein